MRRERDQIGHGDPSLSDESIIRPAQTNVQKEGIEKARGNRALEGIASVQQHLVLVVLPGEEGGGGLDMQIDERAVMVVAYLTVRVENHGRLVAGGAQAGHWGKAHIVGIAIAAEVDPRAENLLLQLIGDAGGYCRPAPCPYCGSRRESPRSARRCAHRHRGNS